MPSTEHEARPGGGTSTLWGPAPGEVLSVGDLLARTRLLLETSFPVVWVEGEIGNTRIPASGHAYFSLSDPAAQLRAVCFRGTLRTLGITPKDGLRVLARGRLTLYEARGDVQLVVEDLEPLGEGAQRLELEARKRRLAAEGLFDLARKRPLPQLPERIGVVTSATGAALRDILNVLARRAPGVSVLVAPTPVQGREAPRAIVEALERVAAEPGVEVVIVGRGGGSAEDLSAFNEEEVVRAVAACPVPVVSAVGHEIDVPLVDFAADARAPTPSAAAELTVREWGQWKERLDALYVHLRSALGGRLASLRKALDGVEKRLQSPSARLDRRRITVDRALERLAAAQQGRLSGARLAVAALEGRLAARAPEPALRAARSGLGGLEGRLHAAATRLAAGRRLRVEALAARLEALGPRAVLARGYAIARTPAGTVLRDARQSKTGDTVEVVLGQGQLDCLVSAVRNG